MRLSASGSRRDRAHARSDRRRRPGRPRARRRSRLARRRLHADREDRRHDRAAEDGPRRRRAPWSSAGAGASPTGCATRPTPATIRRTTSDVTALDRLRARPRAVPRPRASSAARRRARRSASACRRTCSIRSCSASPQLPARDAAHLDRAARLRGDGGRCRRHRARHADRRDPRRSRPTTWSAPTAAPACVRERLGISMSGNPALTYTTNVIFRCPDFAALHDKGKATASSSSGRKAPGSPSWRSTAATASACRSSARPTRSAIRRTTSARRSSARSGATSTTRSSRCMRWVRRELVADSYGTRARLPRRRLRAPDVADRRLRHEHRHAGRGRSRLEARGRCSAAGAAPSCCAPTRSSAGRSRCATSTRQARNLARMLSTRERQPPPEIFQPGPQGDAARKDYGEWFTATMRHEWFMHGFHLGYRYDGSPIDLAGRHAGAAARKLDLHADRAARRIARRTSVCRTGARRSTCSAAASCCCGSAPMRPTATLPARRRGRGRRAA